MDQSKAGPMIIKAKLVQNLAAGIYYAYVQHTVHTPTALRYIDIHSTSISVYHMASNR